MRKTIIGFTFEETEPEPGDLCASCGNFITGKKYVPFVQVGEVVDSQVLSTHWCVFCMIGAGFLSPEGKSVDEKPIQ